ncbi:MAG: formate/nitrite transporter family protein [Clostridia bacterium]|nr:formate/nitrite transporter family protein [Clostridia bacterium]
MKHLKYACSVFLSALLAGFMISIGGAVFLKVSADGSTFGRVFGALLFSIGLFTILAFGLHLYTGKIGLLFLPGKSAGFKCSELCMTLLGNLCGTLAAGGMFGAFLRGQTSSVAVVNAKTTLLEEHPLRLLALAVGCGVLMFVAVYGYNNVQNILTKGILVLFGVGGFILAGFEHSIADMFYVAAAGIWNGKTIGMLALVVLGNSIGGAVMGLLWHLSKKLYPKSEA